MFSSKEQFAVLKANGYIARDALYNLSRTPDFYREMSVTRSMLAQRKFAAPKSRQTPAPLESPMTYPMTFDTQPDAGSSSSLPRGGSRYPASNIRERSPSANYGFTTSDKNEKRPIHGHDSNRSHSKGSQSTYTQRVEDLRDVNADFNSSAAPAAQLDLINDDGPTERKHYTSITAGVHSRTVTRDIHRPYTLPIQHNNLNSSRSASNARARRLNVTASAPQTHGLRARPASRNDPNRTEETEALSFARYAFLPVGVVTLNALSEPVIDHVSNWLEILFQGERYRQEARRTLAVSNHKAVIKSGVCISKHIMRKGRVESIEPTAFACESCDAEARPCIRLHWTEKGETILVVYPRPPDRRPGNATWDDLEYWIHQ